MKVDLVSRDQSSQCQRAEAADSGYASEAELRSGLEHDRGSARAYVGRFSGHCQPMMLKTLTPER